MKRLFLTFALIAVVAGGIIGWFCYDNANRDFTPWMSELELSIYVQKFDVAKPGQRPGRLWALVVFTADSGVSDSLRGAFSH